MELDWNPKGHGGPYTAQHFDVHFYRISLEEHDAIDPARADYAQQASAFPAPGELPAGYVSSHLLMNLPPENQPFTATFIIGSWGGKVIFDEPMVTRDFILAHRDSISGGTSIPVPPRAAMSPRVLHGLVSGELRPRGRRVSCGPHRLAWRE